MTEEGEDSEALKPSPYERCGHIAAENDSGLLPHPVNWDTSCCKLRVRSQFHSSVLSACLSSIRFHTVVSLLWALFCELNTISLKHVKICTEASSSVVRASKDLMQTKM